MLGKKWGWPTTRLARIFLLCGRTMCWKEDLPLLSAPVGCSFLSLFQQKNGSWCLKFLSFLLRPSLPSLAKQLSPRNPSNLEMGFFEKIRFVDWEEESDPVFGDFAFIPLLAVFFPTVRFFLDRFVFEVFRSDSFCFFLFLDGFVLDCCLWTVWWNGSLLFRWIWI